MTPEHEKQRKQINGGAGSLFNLAVFGLSSLFQKVYSTLRVKNKRGTANEYLSTF